MRRNNNYTLERFSPYGIRVHADNVLSDLYASTFVRDITNRFSILLSQSVDHHGFYTIAAEDDKLKELLSIDDYWFLEYDFDKVLSSIMYNLIFANTTFVEIAFSRNETNEIVGISLFPFDAIKIASVCLEGVPDLPVAPQDEAGPTKTFQTWPRGWFHIP